MSAPPPQPSRLRDHAVLSVVLLWLLVFGAQFFVQPVANDSQLQRRDLLRETHWLLLDTVAPIGQHPAASSGWFNLPQRFDLLGVAAALLIAAWGLGHLLLRAVGVPHEPGAERLVFAAGLGLAAWSLLALGLGLAGWLSRWVVIALMATAIGGESLVRIRQRLSKPTVRSRQAATLLERRFFSGSKLPLLVGLAVAPFLLAMLLGAMLPPTDFDVKEYHLQGPKEWYLQGRITFLPHNVYTSFPFLTEMLPLLAMVLRGDWYRGALAGQVVLMCFAPLTAAAIYAAARRVSSSAGWLAAGVYLTTPWVYRISVIPYAEGGLTFYLAAAFLAALAAQRSPADGTGFKLAVLLCGLLAGSAMACKYPGLVSVVAPVGLALVAGTVRTPAGYDWRTACRTAAVYSLGIVVAFGPWALKNIVQTGNPVYPLAYSLFGGADWNAELNAKWKAAHSAPLYLLREPQKIVPDFVHHLLDVVVRSAWQSPLVFGLAPLALLACCPLMRWRRPPGSGGTSLSRPLEKAAFPRLVATLLAYAAWLYVTWWGLTHRIDRFWLPMLPIVCLLGGIGLAALVERIERLSDSGRGGIAVVWSVGCVALLAVATAYNLAFVTSPLAGNNQYLLDEHAARQASMNTTPGIALLDARLPEGARALLVGEAAVFDARFDLRYNTVFDFSLLQMWCAEDGQALHDPDIPLRPRDEIVAALRAQGITHVFVNWLEILRYREPGSYGYTEFVSPRTFAKLVERGVLVPVPLPPRETLVPFDKLSAGKQSEIRRWAPELHTTHDGQAVVLAYGLYAVASAQ